ncbi:MAG: type 1 fimbrial protein, partial [Acinetobacter sp.]|nr:type 1 fimbrial protein [Acinetobacter sp.]
IDASTINPIFIQISSINGVVDFSAPWGVQAKSPIYTLGDETYLQYDVKLKAKALNVAKVSFCIQYIS